MRRGVLAALLLCSACLTGFGFEVAKPPPPRPETPTPKRLQGESAPELEKTDEPGLFLASSAEEQLYYFEPDDLWYRRWRGRWYQAFEWNGFWFPPKQVPDALKRQAAKQQPPP